MPKTFEITWTITMYILVDLRSRHNNSPAYFEMSTKISILASNFELFGNVSV